MGGFALNGIGLFREQVGVAYTLALLCFSFGLGFLSLFLVATACNG